MVQDILLFLVGIVVGTMNAIAGGGMLLGFPVLMATGLSALVANATSCVIVMPGQISSLYAYRSYVKAIPKTFYFLAIPQLIGGIIGVLLLRSTSPDRFEHLIPALILFAVLLFAFQPFLHDHIHYHLHHPRQLRSHIKPIAIIAVAFLPVAIYGGYFGAGYGFIMLALLGFTELHEIHRVNALKNMMTFCVSAVALAILGSSGLINWHHGVIMGIGAGTGGYLGARLAQRISSHAIRITVIVIGLSTALYLLLRSY